MSKRYPQFTYSVRDPMNTEFLWPTIHGYSRRFKSKFKENSKVGKREVFFVFSLNKNKGQETLSHPFLFVLLPCMSRPLNAEMMT